MNRIKEVLKEKGIKHLYVLEVSTEGKLENWEKQPMNERISIRKNAQYDKKF